MDKTIIIIIIVIIVLSSSSSIGGYFYSTQKSSVTSSQPSPSKPATPAATPAAKPPAIPKKKVDNTVQKCVQVDNSCISSWDCNIDEVPINNVNIWWGHTQGAGNWACNSWVNECKGLCDSAYNSQKVKKMEDAEQKKREEQKQENCFTKGDKCVSKWDCIISDISVDSVEIDWGHNKDSGTWACNRWVKECNGNCIGKYKKV